MAGLVSLEGPSDGGSYQFRACDSEVLRASLMLRKGSIVVRLRH